MGSMPDPICLQREQENGYIEAILWNISVASNSTKWLNNNRRAPKPEITDNLLNLGNIDPMSPIEFTNSGITSTRYIKSFQALTLEFCEQKPFGQRFVISPNRIPGFQEPIQSICHEIDRRNPHWTILYKATVESECPPHSPCKITDRRINYRDDELLFQHVENMLINIYSESKILEPIKIGFKNAEQPSTLNPWFAKSRDTVIHQNRFAVVTVKDLYTLRGTAWLNDERSEGHADLPCPNGPLPKVYPLNTFFYPRLSSRGYDSVRSWTSRVINFDEKAINYYDSYGSNGSEIIKQFL
ncbi:hypothetical protein RF11_12803 [Thelohanellus kitauei]|uniref:Uncharacterized protein n=1 Tax=Thelohanellus kitauei TaxID=669202 RepID=A0A0C2MAM6_THEKT|nr:hypothetical protein RF11_12803 [Thelohanellus kitauei]